MQQNPPMMPGFTAIKSPYEGYTASESPGGRTQMHHLGGVAWHDASLPEEQHTCWSQTIGVVNWFTVVHRCACGAISRDGKFWSEKNSTRKHYRKAMGTDS